MTDPFHNDMLPNPLELPVILSEVVKYSRLADLKQIRLVSRSWEVEANKFVSRFPRKFSLHEDRGSHGQDAKTFSNFLRSAWDNPKLCYLYKSFILVDYSSKSLEWAVFLEKFGPSLETLEITTAAWSERMRNRGYHYEYARILDKTPRLTHLYIDVAIWNHLKWSSIPEYDDDFALPYLEILKLLPVVSTHNRRIHNFKSLWKGSEDWSKEPVWTILTNIVKRAPNLRCLKADDANFLPGAVIKDILSQPLLGLRTLLLGKCGTAVWEAGNDEYRVSNMNFLPLLNKSTSTLKLKSLKVPRPDEASQAQWNQLFSRVSTTLVNLDIGDIRVKDPMVLIDNPRDTDKPDLPEIEFRTKMISLETLILHVSMLTPSMKTAKLPVLKHLTVIIDDIEEVEAQFADGSETEEVFEQKYNLAAVKLTVVVNAQVQRQNTMEYPGTNPGIKRLFETIRNFLPNLKELEVRNWVGLDIMNSFLTVFGDQSIAGNIEALQIKDLCYFGNNARRFKELFSGRSYEELDETECQEHSLRNFKNLKRFSFGFDEPNTLFMIDSHFFNHAIRHWLQLESLEFIECRIEEATSNEMKSLPTVIHLNFRKCTILTSQDVLDIFNIFDIVNNADILDDDQVYAELIAEQIMHN